jgi:hypothetical protein
MVEIAKCNGVGNNTSAGLYVWRFSHPRWWSGSWQAVNRLSLPRKHYGPAVLIFQWAGRRKSEPSDFRSRAEPAPINSGPATTLLLFKVKRQIHLQAKSTAKSANREKSPKLAFEPQREQFSGGPGVPDFGQMRVFHAGERESRKLKTRWREGSEFELPVPVSKLSDDG